MCKIYFLSDPFVVATFVLKETRANTCREHEKITFFIALKPRCIVEKNNCIVLLINVCIVHQYLHIVIFFQPQYLQSYFY